MHLMIIQLNRNELSILVKLIFLKKAVFSTAKLEKNFRKMEAIISKYHKPNLVDPMKSPNENTIIMVFNDGHVLSTKGGSVFLQRALFSFIPPIKGINVEMPIKFNELNTYMMVESFEDAEKVREEMIKLNS